MHHLQRLLLISCALAAHTVHAETLPRFPAGAVWNQDITLATPHPDSATIISTWAGLGGFGFGRMQIDFGMNVVHAPVGAPLRSIVGYPYDDYYSPDCEAVGSSMPVPANAAIEAGTGLSCDNENEDCHLLVVQGSTLYEAYHSTGSGSGGLEAQCLAKWDLNYVYTPQGRGDHCTSADAAGFPIAPLLINADEVFAATQVPNGTLGHAIRFILPNERMARDDALGGVEGRLYVRPATHAGRPLGPVGTIPYGARLRLRGNFPMTNYPPAAQVILRTLQRYGMVLSDGGNIALTAESDLYTTHSWDELDIGSRVFDQTVGATDVLPSDFTMIDTGPRIAETYDCVRTVIPTGVLHVDGFE